ncbi:MAG: T9SS type A sorting domain-containing protein [Bacteroidetes bacterium]|nr:T9SS type A sorting domain-containing protein [Bacteroidota bacterium]
MTISFKKFPQGLESVYEVIDTNGRILKSGNVKDEIALSGLQHGVYFLRLSSGNLMGVRKFVKE